MLKRVHLWAILLSCLPALILAQAPRKDRLTLDLYLELESAADPQLSPDGSQIIYTRGGVDKVNDKRETSLWIMTADGARNRFLGDGSNARWSPSGDRIISVCVAAAPIHRCPSGSPIVSSVPGAE